MSYNPSIAYRGPDPATRSLTDELTARFGQPPRPYEFVTGWKDAGNVSGHNPDSDGVTHGVDIFMTPAQNRWTADHLAARGRAGDRRVAYVIYAGQIASPSTGFYFAGEGWEHWDHPHLSVWDGYWGGPCTLPASIYNDTSSWGIASTTGLGSGITPIIDILEDPMGIPKDNLLQIVKAMQSKEFGSWLQKTVMNATAPSADGKNWTLASHLKGTAVRTVQTLKDVAAVRGDIAGIRSQITQLSEGTGVQIDTGKVTTAAREGAAAALSEAQAIDAKLVAEAVLDETAARLAGGEE